MSGVIDLVHASNRGVSVQERHTVYHALVESTVLVGKPQLTALCTDTETLLAAKT